VRAVIESFSPSFLKLSQWHRSLLQPRQPFHCNRGTTAISTGPHEIVAASSTAARTARFSLEHDRHVASVPDEIVPSIKLDVDRDRVLIHDDRQSVPDGQVRVLHRRNVS
jgi:hypothetical protein